MAVSILSQGSFSVISAGGKPSQKQILPRPSLRRIGIPTSSLFAAMFVSQFITTIVAVNWRTKMVAIH